MKKKKNSKFQELGIIGKQKKKKYKKLNGERRKAQVKSMNSSPGSLKKKSRDKSLDILFKKKDKKYTKKEMRTRNKY